MQEWPVASTERTLVSFMWCCARGHGELEDALAGMSAEHCFKRQGQ